MHASKLSMLEIALLVLHEIVLSRVSVILHHIVLLLRLLLLKLLLAHQLGLLLGLLLPRLFHSRLVSPQRGREAFEELGDLGGGEEDSGADGGGERGLVRRPG